MTTDYDPIREQYQRSKLTPWRTHIESFSFLELIGDLAGRSVLDVACGEGFYTRLLKLRGGGRVVGVDLSEGMISLAQAQESERPLGVEYVVGDARELRIEPPFDLVVAAYLLNYATDRQVLQAMCDGIARCLKPGGRFVTVNGSVTLDFRTAPSYRPYGFETAASGSWTEGTPITWTFHLDDGPFSIENYHLPASAHEDALRSAGFRRVRWVEPRVSAEGTAKFGAAFWRTFEERPPITLLECVK